MKARWKFSRLRSAIWRSFGSKACASTPRSRNAPSTALPDRSDISRSAERPPMSTATFPKLLTLMLLPSSFTHDLHFTLKRHARFTLYGFLNQRNQFFDVASRRRALVDDEIRMHDGNLRRSDTLAFQAAFFDQAGRIVARW